MRRRVLRKKVFARDRGVCCDCGLDTEATIRIRVSGLTGEALTAAWKRLDESGFIRHRALWESDHELALDEGGLDDLENVATRCRPCHKEKTAEQAGRKAKQRKLVGRKFLASRKQRLETIGAFQRSVGVS
jgi:5-methylcytosine-specific restriction endonuclease McrA